jgi:hypothetical protein
MLVSLGIPFAVLQASNWARADNQPIATVDDVRSIWDKRRERYQSVEATIRMKTVLERKRIPRPGEDASQQRNEDGAQRLPPDSQFKIWIESTKSRVEFTRDVTIGDQATRIDTFDGTISKALYPSGNPSKGVEHPAGFVGRDKASMFDNVFMIWPFRWAFIGLSAGTVALEPERFALQEEKGVIDESECVIVEYLREGDDNRYVFWCDQNQDLSVLRYIQIDRGIATAQLDCQYKRDDEASIWIPQHWTTWWFDREGRPRAIYEMTTTAFRANPMIASSLFAMEFPYRSVVSDLRVDMPKGRTGTYDYVVMNDGSERRILWREREAPLEQLLSTKSGDAGQPPVKESNSIWLIWVNAGVIVSGLCIYLATRAKRKRGRRNS